MKNTIEIRSITQYIVLLLTIFIILVVFPNQLSSQEILNQEKRHDIFDNKVGLKASNISGYGLFYNKKVSDNLHLQVNGLLYYLNYEEGEDDKKTTVFNYDLGIEIQRNIISDTNSRFYFMFGAYYFYDREKNETKLADISEEEIFTNSYNIGIGVGFEYYFYKRIFVTAEIGYKFYEDRIKTLENGNEVNKSPILERVTKIGASIGIGYTF